MLIKYKQICINQRQFSSVLVALSNSVWQSTKLVDCTNCNDRKQSILEKKLFLVTFAPLKSILALNVLKKFSIFLKPISKGNFGLLFPYQECNVNFSFHPNR